MTPLLLRGTWLRGACVSLSLLTAAGCLSIDGVDVREEEPGDTDGIDAPGDGEGEPDGNLGQPCIDRGQYDLDGVTVQGLAATCNGDAVCVAGVCQAEPVCAPGIDSACRIDFPVKRGPRTRTVAVGAYLYWFETGSNDALGNYQYDGVLARTKPGEWVREEVLIGLDFFAEELGERTGIGIFTVGDYVYADTWVKTVDDLRVHVTSGEMIHGREIVPSCVSDDGTEYIPTQERGEPYAIVRDRWGETRRVDGDAFRDCFVRGNVAWASWGERQDLLTGEKRRYESAKRIIGFDAERVVQVRDSLVSVATPEDAAVLTWRNVMRVTLSRGEFSSFDNQFMLRGDELTWTRVGASRVNTTILRATVGPDMPRVIAEMPLKNYALSPSIVTADAGVVYHDVTLPHFVPVPEVEP